MLNGWSRGRKAVASAVVIALAAGVPITAAILHQGFPVSDVDLDSRDVWVTNAKDQLGGRLNRQIEELDASVQGTSSSIDVLQNGRQVFLTNENAHSIERIDPAYANLQQKADLPKKAETALGGETLAVLDPKDGAVWSVSVRNQLAFDPSTKDPDIELGAGAHVAVTADGAVVATSPKKNEIVTIAQPGALPETRSLDIPTAHQLALVGDTAVILDTKANTVIFGNGTRTKLPVTGMRLQQSSAEHDYALVAASDRLLKVPLSGGAVSEVKADIPERKSSDGVAAPVWLDGCAHGAWADGQRYLLACDGQKPQTETIEQNTAGDRLEFRVNKHVIALNNLDDGNAWLLNQTLRIVNNWDEVTPPQQEESDQESDEKATVQSFEDTLAERTEVNRPPVLQPDSFGVRAGRTTVLPVLDNDTDPDGDVLVITDFTAIDPAVGRLDLIDNGRALQYTPAANAVGTSSFRYTASDGRENGTAETTGDVHVVPAEQNSAPHENRTSSTTVETGQSIDYNVLLNWIDPDGDELQLVAATASSTDQVRFTPDGTITFSHTSGEVGDKEITFTVSDGRATADGVMKVTVQPAGSQKPVGTPDFAQAFTGDTAVIHPLDNDLSPSGAPLRLLGVQNFPSGATVTPNLDQGTIDVTSNQTGAIYFEYSLGAGAQSSVGLIRVDFTKKPDDAPPPVPVKDVAYLREGQTTSVSVLDNDVSPTGRVLGVQTIDTAATNPAVKVELLNSTIIRVSASAALTDQTQFTYTVTDGYSTAVAGVTVVPVAPTVVRQPPIAVDDQVTVREGDIATVHVLDNDRHPDGAEMKVDPQLADVRGIGDGLAFVQGDTVRYQAPKKAGNYTLTYRVRDQYGESATANVTFNVNPRDDENDRAPEPSPLTARVFSGSSVRIDVPLDGIDPDGDSVTLVGYTTAPQLGRITKDASDHFVYEAYATGSGTDTFRYAVADTLGKTSVGEIRIGVLPRADKALQPNAVDDQVEVRPGKTVSLQPLANDSDPNGYTLTLDKQLVEVDKGLDASVDTKEGKVVIKAPDKPGAFNVRYRVSNGNGGQADAFIIVKVSRDAPIQFPTAEDFYLQADDMVKKSTVTVDVGKLVDNPNGLDRDLVVAVTGPSADLGSVQGNSQKVEVTPQDGRSAIAYTVSDPDDDQLTATAFIIVPPKIDSSYSPPPYLDPKLPKQVVPQNGEKEWDLKDILIVPSGRPAIITDAQMVSANHSDGTGLVVDKDTLRFGAEKDFRGATAIVFQVTDGDSKDDKTGRTALITMDLQVGKDDQSDVAPRFTSFTLPIEAGEAAKTVNLRDSTAHPNRSVISQVSYSNLKGVVARMHGDLSGSNLTVSADQGTKVGTSMDLTFDLKYLDYTVPATIHVVTVPSTRPRAQAVTDEVKAQRSKAISTNVLANDYNPFRDQGTPLKLIDAKVDNAAESSAQVSFTAAGDVSVTPGPAFIGIASITYTVQDATEDASRNVTGRLLVNVRDRPDQMSPVTIESEDDQAVRISWKTPATNGEPIENYTIKWGSNGSKTVLPTVSATTIDGLTNGTSYTFTITAENVLGISTPSNPSAAAVPYGLPSKPTGPTLASSDNGSGSVTMTWGAADGNGRAVADYEWRLSDGQTGRTGGGRSATANVAVGKAATFTVKAIGPRGEGASSAVSNAVTPKPGVPRNATATAGGAGDKTVRMTWAAPSGGAPSSYQVSIDGGAWRGANSGDTYEGQFGKSTSFRVRGVVNGVEGAADASNSVTPKDNEPHATVYKGGPGSGSNCASNCRYVAAHYTNLPQGTYTVTPQYKHWGTGDWVSMYGARRTIGGNGDVQSDSFLGQANPAEFPQVRMHFEGPVDFYSEVANWGNL
ncbi:Ig-like domain-containing protein [Schumannella sp. 10F1B-5-1]|uniref:Ig-like domain-containing protein n=1 Tax=Schumannella sp. 10F1B-5-1 TaxID=2590780 RepID=UPI001C64149C|nr:Ig-like domain-containing protein [Schumannella sp. 10F1B-5-1]